MVCDTSSGGGLPTCQIWKAYLERQKSYSSDTICYGCREQFDLEVKGHQQWYATHLLEVVYLHAKYEKPILNDKTITDRTWFVTDAGIDLTLRSKFKIKGHQQWYVTHRLEVVYLHAKYEKPVLNDKSYSPDTICYGCTTQFDLEVKVQGQRSPTMVRNTSSRGGLPTCQICKACLERQKSYSPDTICYGRTDGQSDH
jgi:hypothetical protein